MFYDNNRIYEGTFSNDQKHGNGWEYFALGTQYKGQYFNGKPHGRGKFFWPNGEFYDGEWIQGIKNGKGLWKGIRGDSYFGEWKMGKADGWGAHVWVNGDRYEGQFRDCLKNGQGRENFANGDIYIGHYENGKPQGYGEYFWNNGAVFKGYFFEGLRSGKGIWVRNEKGKSDSYQGDYQNDKKNGYGIYRWANGNEYRGNFFDDYKHGYGEMYWNDGRFYKGLWENGKQMNDENCVNIIDRINKLYKETNILQNEVKIRQYDRKQSSENKQNSMSSQPTPLSRGSEATRHFRNVNQTQNMVNQMNQPYDASTVYGYGRGNQAPSSSSNSRRISRQSDQFRQTRQNWDRSQNFANLSRQINDKKQQLNMTGSKFYPSDRPHLRRPNTNSVDRRRPVKGNYVNQSFF